MEKHYTFSIDPARRLMQFKIWGLWEEAEAKEFVKEMKGHIDFLKTLGNGFYVLADALEYPAQRPEVQAGHRQNMEYAVANGMIKSANIVSSAVLRLQFRHSSQSADEQKFHYFPNEEEAVKWLFL